MDVILDTCRLCGVKSTNPMVKLRDSSLEQKLLKCCQIELNDEDILSQKGCSDCVERLENCFNFISDVATTQEFLKSSGDQLFIVEFIDNKEDIKILELIPDSEVPIKNTRVTRNRKSTQKTPEEVSDEIKTKPVLRPKATKSPAKPAKSTKAKANKNGKLTKRYEKLRYTMKDIFESELAGAFKHITTLAVPENEKNPNGTLTAEGIKRFSSSNWSSLSWKCSDCENVPFKDLNQLQEHYTSTHKQKIVYLCPFCPKTVTKFSSCFNHITEYHKNFLIYCCQVCDDYRWNFMDLYKHQRKAHPDHKIFMCIYCGKNFHCGSILKDHRICCHGKESEQLGSQKQIGHKCNQCDKTFTLKRNLYNHMQSHLEKQHICDKCGLSFLQKGNLVNHQITHSDLRPFKCLVCSTTFKTIKRLRYHNLVHTKIKAHFCDVCNRSFALRTTLKVHYRIHTQVTPYECTTCGKKFRFNHCLTTHIRTHTGERPYSCTVCTHHFTNWPNYNKHMKIRHGIDTSKRAKKRELEVEYLQNNAEGDFTHILAMPAKLPAEIPVEKPEDESYSFSLELPVEELI